MTQVLGTRLHELPDDPRPALLLSDLHVPGGGGEVVARLGGALLAAQRSGARVFVLGDLFDSYVAKAQVRTGVWREVAAKFAAAAAAGVEVHLLVGNRDFLLGAEFATAARVRLVAGGLRVRLDGIDTVLLHGDELCVNDLPYQRAKRWLRQPWLRWVARHLPLGMALGAAERARQKSRMVVQAGDQGRFLPTRAALAAVFATGAAQLVFGHIHRHATGAVGTGRYWVLPAFDASPVALRTAGADLQPVAVGLTGELTPVARPAELALPE